MELIKITENEKGTKLVSARELHKYLDASERFSSWFYRQKQYGFEVGVDYIGCEVFNALANQTLVDYSMTMDMAKQVSMISRSDKGLIARKYFIACEQKLLSLNKPKTRLELARENVLLIEEIESKDLLLLEQEPKVQAFDKVIDNSATFTVDSLSDVVDIGRNKLYDILRSWNWVVKKDKNGTSSTRYGEENRYCKTLFESISLNGNEVNKKRFVLTRKGFELAIKKLNSIQDVRK